MRYRVCVQNALKIEWRRRGATWARAARRGGPATGTAHATARHDSATIFIPHVADARVPSSSLSGLVSLRRGTRDEVCGAGTCGRNPPPPLRPRPPASQAESSPCTESIGFLRPCESAVHQLHRIERQVSHSRRAPTAWLFPWGMANLSSGPSEQGATTARRTQPQTEHIHSKS